MEATLEKLDLLKADKNYYLAKRTPQIVDLDSYYYLVHEGQGSPNEQPFYRAIERLYAVAYRIKFLCKASDMDFVVPKMEGQWWIDGGMENQHLFLQTPESEWKWKIMLRLPDCVEPDFYYRAVQLVKSKKPEFLKDEVKMELSKGGRAVQMLHVGPYDQETPTIMQILNFIEGLNAQVVDYHKEIYLRDPRRTEAEKLRTIIRYAID